jgi:hypothetical protein
MCTPKILFKRPILSETSPFKNILTNKEITRKSFKVHCTNLCQFISSSKSKLQINSTF